MGFKTWVARLLVVASVVGLGAPLASDPAAAADPKPNVGDVRMWPASAVDVDGFRSYYPKEFQLRAVNPDVEVWTPVGDDVSRGLDFPAGDCRNGDFTSVSDAQTQHLANEFRDLILPEAADVFGRAPVRGGTRRLVVLVDNFRGPDFYDAGVTDPPEGGFVDTEQITMTGRNVLNLSGRGWQWGLGPDPRPEVVSDEPCVFRYRTPNWIEATLAHEYIHVLQAGVGRDFESLHNDPAWVKEGLATWFMHRIGYIDPNAAAPYLCFEGHLSAPGVDPFGYCPGGPNNSLTMWGHAGQVPGADYGAAGTFMAFLAARYGERFMGDLLRTTGVWGAAKVDAVLARHRARTTFNDLVVDWAGALAIDGVIDDGARMTAGERDRYRIEGLRASVAWDSPFANRDVFEDGTVDSFGPFSNASDFTRLRGAGGESLGAAQLQSLDFTGDTHLACMWMVDPNGHGPGDAALYSGGGNLQNRGIAVALDVPAAHPTLEFDLRYEIEAAWDFAYVQVSTDGGTTWTSVAAPGTTGEHDPLAKDDIVADLPGFTGDSGGWVHEQVDLSAYAGQHVLVAFRYRTDWGVVEAGMWVDNVVVGGQLISDGSTIEPFEHLYRPVYRLAVQVVSYTDDHRAAAIAQVTLDAENDAHLDADQLRRMVAPGAQTVGVIITQVQPGEELCPVRYQLTVNGVRQLGG